MTIETQPVEKEGKGVVKNLYVFLNLLGNYYGFLAQICATLNCAMAHYAFKETFWLSHKHQMAVGLYILYFKIVVWI